MSPKSATFTQNSHFENKIVDNDGFFDAIEKEMPSILSISRIQAQTRLEIKELFAQMKQRTFIKGVTEWTAQEQKNFFHKVKSEVQNVGILTSMQIRKTIQPLVEDEIWREVNDNGKKYNLQDIDENPLNSDEKEYQQLIDTHSPFIKEINTVPLDLRLTIGETETIEDAKKKIAKYGGKYNALVFVDADNHPIGVVKYNMLAKYKNTDILTRTEKYFTPNVFGYSITSSNDAKNMMREHDINILPIIDSKTGVLMGILTSNSLIKKDLQYYSATSLTELSLDHLRMNT